ncbi:hypothetical protein KDL01_40685 [Actinospica durhamensis]|uniref:BMP family ABC transporter substrate-binding protein n=1 Tax=Actinospica durhamensis TaxID=1508375 RepID=A0A941ITD9_9ACTN|nr:hypothetical protein [Actinospica durhamensis]MBR7839639.1 hypothetical protein [Actinospica durhamensis]
MARSGAHNHNNLPKARAKEADRRASTRWLNTLLSNASRLRAVIRRHPRPSAAVGVMLVAGLVSLAVLQTGSSPAPYHPAARSRQYADYTACLLTDESGVSGPAAAAVWSGMQQASTKTTEQVSYLAVQGDQSLANAETYFNTLAGRGCDIILAAGPLPTQAATARSAAYPKITVLTYPNAGSSAGTETTTDVEASLTKAFSAAG